MASAAFRPIPSESVVLRPDLATDRRLIEHELRRILPPSSASAVAACMDYAVLGDAQRLRPLLAVRTGRLADADERLTLRGAAAVEILHCASLIVDDLPCMDNDATRRNRPAAHVAYGESTALLAAFGLVALAARTVIEQEAPEAFWPGQKRLQVALLRTLDCTGLIGGQVMDLELSGERREACRDLLNELKTVPLFQLAIEAGLAYAPAAPDGNLRQFGRQYGIALQMTDDFLDGECQDFAAVAGQLKAAESCLLPYGVAAAPLRELVEYLDARAQDHCHR